MSDEARLTLRVEAPRELAFRVFTDEIDAWWRRGRRYRMGGEKSTMALEPRCGGRLYERVEDGDATREYELGRVLVWDPPRRLLIAFRPVNFSPEDPSTEVEVTFERALGHRGEGTLVSLMHRGWSRVRDGHPVRHGEAPRVFIARHARWWGDLLSSLRERLEAPRVR